MCILNIPPFIFFKYHVLHFMNPEYFILIMICMYKCLTIYVMFFSLSGLQEETVVLGCMKWL